MCVYVLVYNPEPLLEAQFGARGLECRLPGILGMKWRFSLRWLEAGGRLTPQRAGALLPSHGVRPVPLRQPRPHAHTLTLTLSLLKVPIRDHPVKTNQIPRHVPPPPLAANPWLMFVFGE